jgi:hypothetical protein
MGGFFCGGEVVNLNTQILYFMEEVNYATSADDDPREDKYDIAIAESRKDDEDVDWEAAKRELVEATWVK